MGNGPLVTGSSNHSGAPELMQPTNVKPSRPIPPLSLQVAFARKLIECILYLHTVDWLQKAIHSNNIPFYSSTSDSINLSRFQLSGFKDAHAQTRKVTRPRSASESSVQKQRLELSTATQAIKAWARKASTGKSSIYIVSEP